MADAATIVRAGGGLVSFATDPSAYLPIRGTSTESGVGGWAIPTQMAQVCQWAAPSSIWSTVIASLSAAGFVSRPMGGGPNFLAVSGSSVFGLNVGMTFWQTSTS